MEFFALYAEPEDTAGRFAVERILVADDGLQAQARERFRTLIEARSVLARQGLVRVPRGPADAPALLETWV